MLRRTTGFCLFIGGCIAILSQALLPVLAVCQGTQWGGGCCLIGGPFFEGGGLEGGTAGCGVDVDSNCCHGCGSDGPWTGAGGCNGSERWESVFNGSCESGSSCGYDPECRMKSTETTAIREKLIANCEQPPFGDCDCVISQLSPPETDEVTYCDCEGRESPI